MTLDISEKQFKKIELSVLYNKTNSNGGLNKHRIKYYLKQFKINYNDYALRYELLELLKTHVYNVLKKQRLVNYKECEEPSNDINENIRYYLYNAHTHEKVCVNQKHMSHDEDTGKHCCNSNKPPSKEDVDKYLKYLKNPKNRKMYYTNQELINAYTQLFSIDQSRILN